MMARIGSYKIYMFSLFWPKEVHFKISLKYLMWNLKPSQNKKGQKWRL